MSKVIFTADDYGCINEINKGAIDAIDKGKINSVSAFANGPVSENGFRELKERERAGKVEVGCHLTITSGEPLTNIKEHFYKEKKGKRVFRSFTNLKRKDSLRDKTSIKRSLFLELQAQIEVLLDYGFDVKHLSSHHNSLNFFPEYLEVLIDLARYYNVKVRSPLVKSSIKEDIYIWQLQMRSLFNLSPVDLNELETFSENMNSWIQARKNNPGSLLTNYEGELYRPNPNPNFPSMPNYICGKHYGPIPFVRLEEEFKKRGNSKIRRKRKVNLEHLFSRKAENKANKLMKDISLIDDTSVEYTFHLFSPPSNLSELNSLIQKIKQETGDYRHPKFYPGVDTNYFDSRVIEYKSIIENVSFSNLSSWDSI